MLVIEDEPQMRAMLTDNLEFEGYRVTSVESGEDALRECNYQAFALLIVDVMLPGMSGFELCERLRARGARSPIIMLTALTHEQDRDPRARARRGRLRQQAVQRARAARPGQSTGPARRLAFVIGPGVHVRNLWGSWPPPSSSVAVYTRRVISHKQITCQQIGTSQPWRVWAVEAIRVGYTACQEESIREVEKRLGQPLHCDEDIRKQAPRR